MKAVALTILSFFIVIFALQAGIVIAGVLCVGIFLYVSWIEMKNTILSKKLHKKHDE